jgi:ABC-type nitrate/sulfonate/bicarbonate transport system ATPase subunit
MNITVSNLSFGYSKEAWILKNLDFSVEHNRVTGVLGSSGCGKSTLLRLLCGILPNSPLNVVEGEVTFDGTSPLSQLREQGRMGLMFQEPSLLPNLTVEKNVRFPLDILGNKDGRIAVSSLIETVGLTEFRHFLPKHLSGGMQTRAALARTFVTRPDLLLLDEPFSALDYGWKMDLYGQLSHLIKTFGATVVIVSHDINEVVLLADKVLLVSKSGCLIRSAELPKEKPSSFAPDKLGEYFNSIKEEILLLQDTLLRERTANERC